MVNLVKILFVSCILFIFVNNIAFADIPQLISVQGRLTDNSNVPYTTLQSIEFSIWDSASLGVNLWDDTFAVTPDYVGLFDVTLGSGADLNLDFDVPYYLQVKIGGETLLPRYSMTSAGYAFSVGPGKLSGPIEIDGNVQWTGSLLAGSVPWVRLSGVPSGLDDGDQVGITSESDPLSIHTSGGGTITGNLIVNGGLTGVYSTGSSTGVQGGSSSGNGVVGTSDSSTGVWGGSQIGNGVYGSTDGNSASGVFGNNGGSGNGVAGVSVSGYSGYFTGGLGVYVDGKIKIADSTQGVGKVLTSDASGVASWQNPSGGLPAGMIAMFDTNCPLGWTRFAALDGRVTKGSSSYGVIGGSDIHTHSLPVVVEPRYRGGNDMAINGLTSGSTSSWPPYLEVIWCQKD